MQLAKPINARTHAIIDLGLLGLRAFSALALVKVAPRVAIGSGIAATLAGASFAMTNMPFAPVKAVSLKNHVRVSFAVAPLLAIIPHAIGLGDSWVRFAFYGDAAAVLISSLLTRTDSKPRAAKGRAIAKHKAAAKRVTSKPKRKVSRTVTQRASAS